MSDELAGPQLTKPLIEADLLECQLCEKPDGTVDRCCNAHGKWLCNSCYNRTHFVEVKS